MTYLYIILSAAGAAAAGWGLRAAHRFRAPWDSLAALAALAGLITFILGILLAVLPDFFTT